MQCTHQVIHVAMWPSTEVKAVDIDSVLGFTSTISSHNFKNMGMGIYPPPPPPLKVIIILSYCPVAGKLSLHQIAGFHFHFIN